MLKFELEATVKQKACYLQLTNSEILSDLHLLCCAVLMTFRMSDCIGIDSSNSTISSASTPPVPAPALVTNYSLLLALIAFYKWYRHDRFRYPLAVAALEYAKASDLPTDICTWWREVQGEQINDSGTVPFKTAYNKVDLFMKSTSRIPKLFIQSKMPHGLTKAHAGIQVNIYYITLPYIAFIIYLLHMHMHMHILIPSDASILFTTHTTME